VTASDLAPPPTRSHVSLLPNMGPVSGDLSLFGDDEPTQQLPPAQAVTPIAEWQVDLLRKALDARGLESMDDRQRAIEAATGRAVESLRALTHGEALQVLTRLGPTPASERPTTSLWDDRDEDTWIDRL
jgi:hypothetical protein